MRFKKFEEFQEKDLEPIKSFYLKDELNPKLWDNFELDEEVREKLLQIAQDFYNSTELEACLLYTSPSPRDRQKSRMPSSA